MLVYLHLYAHFVAIRYIKFEVSWVHFQWAYEMYVKFLSPNQWYKKDFVLTFPVLFPKMRSIWKQSCLATLFTQLFLKSK